MVGIIFEVKLGGVKIAPTSFLTNHFLRFCFYILFLEIIYGTVFWNYFWVACKFQIIITTRQINKTR